MKLRARLLFITASALLVPLLVAIGVAAALVVESGGRSQESRFRSSLSLIKKDIAATELRYRAGIARLALSPTLQSKLYVYNKYWGYFSKDTLDGDIAVLRDDLENHLLSEAIDTIAVYRVEKDHYAAVVVVGNSTYISDSVPHGLPASLAGQPEYAQMSDGIYATFYMPVFRNGEEIGMISLQKAFNRSYLETLSLRAGIEIAFYAQGLYRYSSLPGIDTAGVLWTRAHPMTGSPFSGQLPLPGPDVQVHRLLPRDGPVRQGVSLRRGSLIEHHRGLAAELPPAVHHSAHLRRRGHGAVPALGKPGDCRHPLAARRIHPDWPGGLRHPPAGGTQRRVRRALPRVHPHGGRA